MATTYDRQAKLIREVAKEHMLRKMADFKMSGNTLLEIFGLSLQHKLTEQSNPHNRMGKHYGTNHNQRKNPAGCKLAKKFRDRATYERLTGRDLEDKPVAHVAS